MYVEDTSPYTRNVYVCGYRNCNATVDYDIYKRAKTGRLSQFVLQLSRMFPRYQRSACTPFYAGRKRVRLYST